MKWLGGGDGSVVSVDMDREPQRTQDDAAVGYEFQRPPDPEFPVFGQKQARWALGDDSIIESYDKWKYPVNSKMATPPTMSYLGPSPTMGPYDMSQSKNVGPDQQQVMYLSNHLAGQIPGNLPMHPQYMTQNVQTQIVRQGSQRQMSFQLPRAWFCFNLSDHRDVTSRVYKERESVFHSFASIGPFSAK